jgi:hypothetical protein
MVDFGSESVKKMKFTDRKIWLVNDTQNAVSSNVEVTADGEYSS